MLNSFLGHMESYRRNNLLKLYKNAIDEELIKAEKYLKYFSCGRGVIFIATIFYAKRPHILIIIKKLLLRSPSQCLTTHLKATQHHPPHPTPS